MKATEFQLDIWEAHARNMSVEGLLYSIDDCIEAGKAAWGLDQAGCRVSKTQGHYHDEASVYRRELVRRQKQKR